MTTHTQSMLRRPRPSSRSAHRSRRRPPCRRFAFDTNADLLKTPLDVFVGEVGGVGTEFEGPDLRLHADGPSVRDARRQPDVLRAAARGCSSSTGPASSSASSDRTSTASTPRSACGSIRRTTSGRSTRRRIRWSSSTREGRVALVLGRKPETISVRPGRRPAAAAAVPDAGRGGPQRPGRSRRRRLPAAARRGGGGGRGGRGGGLPGAGHAGLHVQPSDRRRVGPRRQHLHRRRHRQHQPHCQVRQGRPLHQAVGIDRFGERAVHRREEPGRSTRRATSTWPTPATSASRCSTATATSSRSSGTSARR